MTLTKNHVGARASPWHWRFQIGLRGTLFGLTLACVAAALASYWLPEVRYRKRLALIEREVQQAVQEARALADRDPEWAETDIRLLVQMVEATPLLKDADRRRMLDVLRAEKYPSLPEVEVRGCYECVRLDSIPIEEPVVYGDACG